MDNGSRGSPRIRSTALAAGAGMDYDLAIGDQSELWAWQSQEYDLEKDLLAAPSSSLWDASHNVDGNWNMFDEQTPIKHCTDFEFQFSDTGEIVKDFEGGKETFQAKRRRMLQFCPENAEMTCSMTEDGLSESLQEMDFSGTDCLLNTDGTDELPEEWLVNCPQDIEPCLPAEEIRNSPAAATVNAVPISVYPNSSPRQQSIIVHSNPAQARPTPLKAGKNIIGSKKLRSSVAFPFELIKPCSIQGAVTLNDINKKIHAPPPYKIRHKSDEEPNSLHASAISGKPVVRKTKIHTDGGKGSITITTTRG